MVRILVVVDDWQFQFVQFGDQLLFGIFGLGEFCQFGGVGIVGLFDGQYIRIVKFVELIIGYQLIVLCEVEIGVELDIGVVGDDQQCYLFKRKFQCVVV